MSLETLGISGIRGYSPQAYQKIQFFRPLTLIWGKNGSGKTTIIECLKYITTGSMPPNTDKGKNFIMDTKVAGKPEVIGDIRLIFKTGNRAILAKRRIQLSAKGANYKFESIEQVLKTKDEKGEELTINHQCAEIEKQVPQLLGISKPILENIVFCHQEESLWPFGDNMLLKSIFDELFDTKKVAKEMDNLWDTRTEQMGELKELKIRLEYEKAIYKKQMDDRTKAFQDYEALKLAIKDISDKKQKLLEIKGQLKDTSEMSIQRDKLILRQGKLISSIKEIEGRMRMWRQKILRVERNHQQKIQGSGNHSIESEEFMDMNRSNNSLYGNQRQFSEQELENATFIELVSPALGVEELEQKRALFTDLTAKHRALKENYETMCSFKETTKREQEIKSQMDRIKGLYPEMKSFTATKSSEDFLKLFKQKLTEMEQKITGIAVSKAALLKIEREMPPMIELGYSEQEEEETKRESKELQTELSKASLKILKIFKAQYKNLPDGMSSLLSNEDIKKGQRLTQQLQQINAVIASKQKELQKYKKLAEKQQKDNNNNMSLERRIMHLHVAGVQVQEHMIKFCQQKKKCYYCQRSMNDEEVKVAKAKAESIKNKSMEKLEAMERERGEEEVDGGMMVGMINEELKGLCKRRDGLQKGVKEFEVKNRNKQVIERNNTMMKEMKKCNLSLDMLPKILVKQGEWDRQEGGYVSMQLDKFVQLSSQYQIILARYRVIKEQATKIQKNKLENEVNSRKRETCLREKLQLQEGIRNGQQQTKGYEFLKNSYGKLESLMRLENKSRGKKGGKEQANSQSSSNMTIEEMESKIHQVYVNILEEKTYIEKLQISIAFDRDQRQYQIEKQALKQVEDELNKLGSELKQKQSLITTYNTLHLQFTRQTQRHRHLLTSITAAISTPPQPTYLSTLNKIAHLQASIADLQDGFNTIEQCISEYHSQKMDEINRYIFEVWKQIYHGQDIQYIQIQAVTDAATKKRKKNYLYRILMKKRAKNFGQKQEMIEMKGRCSTGQKVLASIVIRLALAQVFCSRARILTLDEPTTNLDKEHIKNLALSLLRLIELSGGKNLQLIIISHDMEFIKMLQKYADSYYEVTRDANRFSAIQKKSIKDIFDSR